MDNTEEITKRIFESLDTAPKPAGYVGKIPWTVQQQIAATNGVHFLDTIGKLQEYPIPEMPIGPGAPDSLLLDIGNGWGRWLVAAANKNYIPVGIDIRHEFAVTARQTLQANGQNGYTIVADLQHLPFANDVFNVVWSFSVIQHTHFDRMMNCIKDIERILTENGFCFLEFPNKKGIRNRIGPAAGKNNAAFNSWDVRYYSPDQYRIFFEQYFDNFSYVNHSVLGIGILPGDLAYARGMKNKAIIAASRALSKIADVIKPMKAVSDSIYVKSTKRETQGDLYKWKLLDFLTLHRQDPRNNLNIVPLLACPYSGDAVILSDNRQEVICVASGFAYPVKDGIPIMVREAARRLHS